MVGVAFRVGGAPGAVEVRASEGTGYSILWAETIPANFGGWESVGSGTVLDGPATLQLPDRDGGFWLLWLTDLPEQAVDEFFSVVLEVTFSA